MGAANADDIARLLDAAASGDETAADRLLPLLYDELRSLAAARLARVPPGQTLSPTALVHEAYLRVAGKQASGFESRAHFFFVAARAMRDILVEQARRKGRRRRLVEHEPFHQDENALAIESPSDEILTLHEALRRLESEDSDGAQLVMLRYFAGLTNDEVADVLGVSASSIDRRWRFVKAWLRREISGAGSTDDSGGSP
jgi:RNA polymerase sigma factor (TIGR02999 family)